MNGLLNRTSNVARIMWEFIKKDFRDASSYRISFMMLLFGTITWALVYSFQGSSIEYQIGLDMYRSNPIQYLISGMAMGIFIDQVLVATEVVNVDNFDEALTTPIPIWMQALCYNVWGYTLRLSEFTMYLVVGWYLGMTFNTNILSLILVILASVTFNTGYGLLNAGLKLAIKRGDPVHWTVSMSSQLLSGNIFPITVLPLWLQRVSWCLPQTWILYLWRLALFGNISPVDTDLNSPVLKGSSFVFEFIILGFIAVFFLVLGIAVWRYGIRKCMTQGLAG